jgi:hypothetical protein
LAKRLRKVTAQVMGELKSRCARGEEVHHVFGKRWPRLKACRLFCVLLMKPRGGASHEDQPPEIKQAFRDDMRDEYNEFLRVNYQNRDQSTCWYACMYHDTCQLWEEKL